MKGQNIDSSAKKNFKKLFDSDILDNKKKPIALLLKNGSILVHLAIKARFSKSFGLFKVMHKKFIDIDSLMQ